MSVSITVSMKFIENQHQQVSIIPNGLCQRVKYKKASISDERDRKGWDLSHMFVWGRALRRHLEL